MKLLILLICFNVCMGRTLVENFNQAYQRISKLDNETLFKNYKLIDKYPTIENLLPLILDVIPQLSEDCGFDLLQYNDALTGHLAPNYADFNNTFLQGKYSFFNFLYYLFSQINKKSFKIDLINIFKFLTRFHKIIFEKNKK